MFKSKAESWLSDEVIAKLGGFPASAQAFAYALVTCARERYGLDENATAMLALRGGSAENLPGSSGEDFDGSDDWDTLQTLNMMNMLTVLNMVTTTTILNTNTALNM